MYPTYPSLSFISLSSLTLYIETAMTLEGEAKMGLILKTELAISSQFSTFPATTISLKQNTAQCYLSVTSQIPAGHDSPIGPVPASLFLVAGTVMYRWPADPPRFQDLRCVWTIHLSETRRSRLRFQ